MQLKPSKATRTVDISRTLSTPDRSVLARPANNQNVNAAQLLEPDHGYLSLSSNSFSGTPEPPMNMGPPPAPGSAHHQPGDWSLPFDQDVLDQFTFDFAEPVLGIESSNDHMAGPSNPFSPGSESVSVPWTPHIPTVAGSDVQLPRLDDQASPAQMAEGTHSIEPRRWEHAQIHSVRRMSIPSDPSIADYVWLSNDPELNTLHQGTVESTSDEQDSELPVAGPDSDASKRLQVRRGPFKTPALREQTSNTRKLKACVRCRTQRIRVSCDVSPVLNSADLHSASRTRMIRLESA